MKKAILIVELGLMVILSISTVPAARAAILMDASCVLECIRSERTEESDLGLPRTVQETGPVYVDFEGLDRQSLELRMADREASDRLCRKAYGAGARTSAFHDCRYFRH